MPLPTTPYPRFLLAFPESALALLRLTVHRLVEIERGVTT